MLQVPNIVFLQELLAHQDRFASHYAEGLDGCGLGLEADVRRAFYTLARRMIDSVKATERLELDKSVPAALVTAFVHNDIDVKAPVRQQPGSSLSCTA